MMQSMNLTTLEVLDMSDDNTGGTSILGILQQAVSNMVNLARTASIPEILQQVLLILAANIPGLRGSQLFYNAALQTLFTKALSPLGLQGILSGSGVRIPGVTFSTDGIPVYYNLGLADSVQSTLDLVNSITLIMRQRPLFLNVYLMAWNMGPSDIQQVIQQLGSEYDVVKPGTLLNMIAQAHSQAH